jgi:hypothetical protein
MLATVSFNAFLRQLVGFVAGLSVNCGGHLQEELPLEVGREEFVEREELGLYFIEGKVALQYLLNEMGNTSHMKSVISFRTIFSLRV